MSGTIIAIIIVIAIVSFALLMHVASGNMIDTSPQQGTFMSFGNGPLYPDPFVSAMVGPSLEPGHCPDNSICPVGSPCDDGSQCIPNPPPPHKISYCSDGFRCSPCECCPDGNRCSDITPGKACDVSMYKACVPHKRPVVGGNNWSCRKTNPNIPGQPCQAGSICPDGSPCMP